jgi:1-deoxy-D-xylulose-5-phosphate synthase
VGSGLSARLIRQGDDVCILAVGKLVEAAEGAAVLLEAHGVSATVWDVRVVKPLDEAMIAAATTHPLVVTAEDGIREGGVGTAIGAAIAARKPGQPSPPVIVLGVPDRYVPQGKPADILADLGLDATGIATSVLEARGAAELSTVRSPAGG